MSRLGMADLGVATMNDMRDHAAMIASIDPTVPLVADADTGYGGMPPLPPSLTSFSPILFWPSVILSQAPTI
jgi:hypothetical protein